MNIYGEHHAAEALRDIRKTLANWTEGAAGGLSVVARDGDAKDARVRERRAQRLAEQQAKQDADPGDPE